MAGKKKKDNRLGSDPFDSVLPFIQDSRKKKDDDVSSDEDTTDDVNKNIINDVDNDSDVNETVNNDEISSEIVNNDVYNDVNVADDVSEIVDVDENIITSESVIISKNEDVTTSQPVNNGQGGITIEKKVKLDNYVRMTHYFRPDQIRAIDRLHKQSGRDKSELVRMAIDILVEQARVE